MITKSCNVHFNVVQGFCFATYSTLSDFPLLCADVCRCSSFHVNPINVDQNITKFCYNIPQQRTGASSSTLTFAVRRTKGLSLPSVGDMLTANRAFCLVTCLVTVNLPRAHIFAVSGCETDGKDTIFAVSEL